MTERIYEPDCTVTIGGMAYTSTGADFHPDTGGYLYIGEQTGVNRANDGINHVPYGALTTWHGERVGTWWAIRTYRNNLGGRITCIQARVNGRDYHGRYGADYTQLIRLVPSKNR